MENIKFVMHEPWEFAYAVYEAGGIESLLKELKENKIELDEFMSKIVDTYKLRISKFLKSEMDYFFDYKHNYGGIGLMLLASMIRRNPDINKVQDFILCINDTDENIFMSYAVCSLVFYNEDKFVKDICDWESVKCSSAEMLKLVNSVDEKYVLYKDVLIECLENPLETKERFCLMLRQFYERVYREIEDEVYEKCKHFEVRYEDKFKKDENKFISLYLNTSVQNIKDYDVKVHVSYFNYYGESSWGNLDNNTVWYVLGAYSDKYYADEDEYDKNIFQLLFKTLSDKKRLDMVELLAKRPWYVSELAEQLGLTAATVSYHISMLWRFNIIKFERSDHRIYYSLDKERLKDIIENFTKGLLNV